MLKKKLVFIGLLFTLVICSSFLTHAQAAQENAGSDLEAADEAEFEEIINNIVTLKKNHPEYTEDTIIARMDQQNLNKARGISDIWNALTYSEKILCIRYPFDALKVNQDKNIATSQTEIKFGYNGLGDRSDAFRHGIWNAEMTVLIGKQKAKLFATAHEDIDVAGNESDGYPKSAHKEMDLHNNEVGRNIGDNNVTASEDEMSDIIYDVIYSENSQFIWLHD